MRSRSSPGLGQWVIVTFIVAVAVFLLYRVYQYGNFRQFYPAGLSVGGVNVGGLDRQQAEELLTSRYITADIIIFHGENSVAVSPSRAEFRLDLDTMFDQADFQREQQDFWAGFWGFLWNRPVAVEAVDLRADYQANSLRSVLETISSGFDISAQPPQPVPSTLSFQYGDPGIKTNIDASLDDVVAAMYRPTQREAQLTIEIVEPERPDISILARLIVNHIQDVNFSGVASIFILDLQSGEEVRIESGAAMSGIDLMRLPIVMETYRTLENTPSISQTQRITNTLLTSEFEDAIALLNVVAGQDNAFLGADIVTESMQRLGLANTFMATPYEYAPRPELITIDTPANSLELALTSPDPAMQTTSEDMGTLLAMLYYCAYNNGGALRAAYVDEISQAECLAILDYMQTNSIGSLIEEGVPGDVSVAHRHGWVGDTHGDAGIVYSPSGDYVLVQLLYQPEWLPWEVSSPLMAQISQATYNYFNFDAPYLGSRTN